MKKFKNFVTEKDRCWKGYEPVPGKKAYSKGSCRKVEEEEDEESVEIEESVIDYVFDLIEWNEDLQEATKDGKSVTLNKPFRTPGGPKKFAVYTKNEKGNVVKVGFGDPNMEIKRDDADRRSNFRARHNCDNPGPKWKARYWSCKFWEKGKSVSSLLDFYDPCCNEAKDPYKKIDYKKLQKGHRVDKLVAKDRKRGMFSQVRYMDAEVISGSGTPSFRVKDENGKIIIVPSRDVVGAYMKNESTEILESVDQLNNPKATDFLVRGLKRRNFQINDLKDLANLDMIKQKQALDYLVRALRSNADPVQAAKLRDDIRVVLNLKAK